MLRRLPDYLREQERQHRRPFVGIATDGRLYEAYELRGQEMVLLGRAKADPERPEALLAWLEPVLSERDDLPADAATIARELGRESLAFRRAEGRLLDLWRRLCGHPEVRLKRELWDGLLREAYGAPVGEDSLFLQHSYLVIVAKTIAARALDLPAEDAAAILSGKALAEEQIFGAVEADFFDWPLALPEGHALVGQIARQVARFRLHAVEQDVLKALYESLMDPEQRHDLGEYYTPDWLAAKVVRHAIRRPLEQVVLDQACGSGTFLFHAIRHLRAAAARAGLPPAEAVARAARQVRGMDVHPVAVIFARVTWLLACGEDLAARPRPLHVPVFLGDALQWNISAVGAEAEVRVAVPGEPPLRLPAGLAEEQERLDAGLTALAEGLSRDAPPGQVGEMLRRQHGVSEADAAVVEETLARLKALYRAQRNGIWPYVMRNLVRPLWLSRPANRADVLIGNPAWVAYRRLSPELQARLRDACIPMRLWVGGHLATQQDIAALFVARGAERYLKQGGVVAQVLPYAVLNRPAFEGLRRGACGSVELRWQRAWSLDEGVQPLFPVPAAVLFGRRAPAGPLPRRVLRFSGRLPRRDATEAEANPHLSVRRAPWPPTPTLAGASPYRARFAQGATIVPRRFFLVERVAGGRLASAAAPRVRGRTGGQDKPPWNRVDPPEGPVELPWLRPVVLGESLAPFRLLSTALAVLAVDDRGRPVGEARARIEGSPGLAEWLRRTEALWAEHAARGRDGRPKMTLWDRLDFQCNFSRQFPIPPLRVVYAKAGTLMAACILQDGRAVVEHAAYWAPARDEEEARYLTALLNADSLREILSYMQPKGQGGARHFDNLFWELPIPEFARREARHRRLVALAEKAEAVAAAATWPEGAHFTAARRAVRVALRESGLQAELDEAALAVLG
ncbi:MAG: N-6 DNA methylase [Acetobacteraceae bacterium]|nr:N-6 DNA methylase [Acetobacteraceae bacterium]